MANLLFICSKNRWRSPTAEMLFMNKARHQARSAGTSGKARIKVTEKLLNWADEIFVMEQKHKALINQRFPGLCQQKKITVLDIEDHFRYRDPELVLLLKEALEDYL